MTRDSKALDKTFNDSVQLGIGGAFVKENGEVKYLSPGKMFKPMPKVEAALARAKEIEVTPDRLSGEFLLWIHPWHSRRRIYRVTPAELAELRSKFPDKFAKDEKNG